LKNDGGNVTKPTSFDLVQSHDKRRNAIDCRDVIPALATARNLCLRFLRILGEMSLEVSPLENLASLDRGALAPDSLDSGVQRLGVVADRYGRPVVQAARLKIPELAHANSGIFDDTLSQPVFQLQAHRIFKFPSLSTEKR
jgi:hypothetical protein